MPNPFAALGLDPQFDLDASNVHECYIRALASTHPDRFLDPMDQADAAERTAQINEAYRVLSDPELRAEALLGLLGGPTREEDKSLPPELLAQMMEIRETWDAAADADDQATLKELRSWVLQQHREALARVAALFTRLAGAPNPDAHFKTIRLELNALRYFRRMLDQTPHNSAGE
jgi:molecular chaperone HscB